MAEEQRNWLELPREVTASIMSRLVAVEILTSVQVVCKAWLEVAHDPLVWRRIDMSKLRCLGLQMDLEKMCRCAIDRSSGQLADINIEYFGSDDLLKYIAERASQIKRLRLACCSNKCSDRGLVEAVEKLPLREDLELTLCPFSVESLNAIGCCCPNLKSFRLNCQACRIILEFSGDEELEFNREAFAIQSNMPGLRNLQVIGNTMTNMGLEAILDGCPELESLDLRKCFNISVKGDVWKRCTQQIKHLRLPGDDSSDLDSFGTYGYDDYDRDDDDLDDDEDDRSSYGYDYDFADDIYRWNWSHEYSDGGPSNSHLTDFYD